MLDERFYRRLGPVGADALARGGELVGPSTVGVNGVNALAAAGADDVAFFEGDGPPPSTGAGILILSAKHAERLSGARATIITSNPRAHFARVARLVAEEIELGADAPQRDPLAVLEENVVLGPGVVLGAGARIGADTRIGPNAVVGPGVAIGRRCHIGANATITCALIGDYVTILPGAAIGQPGFGVALSGDAPVDIPHFGRVIIQDGVSIGANATIDRGVFGDTTIAEHAKIDNLCHIAHNVTVGRGAIMAAFAGISGTVDIGDGVMMGGRVGVADHVQVGRGAVLAAGSAVMHDVPAGQRWAGYPAKPIRQWLRETAWLSRAIGKRDGGDV
jgi:UDP-3-O-[3-hydroxymyristoyl] glucosamine N-acyltransferase